MPSNQFSGVRKINKSDKKSSKSRNNSKNNSRNNSKSNKKSSKSNSTINNFVNAMMNDINIPEPEQQTNVMQNGLQNPYNIEYDPLHVHYMMPQSSMDHLKQFSFNYDNVTNGVQNNNLSQMFSGKNMGEEHSLSGQSSMPQMAMPQMSVPQMGIPQMSVPQMGVPQMSVPQMSMPMGQNMQLMNKNMVNNTPQTGGSIQSLYPIADFKNMYKSLAHM